MDIISTSILDFLVKNVPTMVVKFHRDAKANETLESRKEADIYISAKNGTDSWITYPEFNEEIVQTAGSLIPVIFTQDEVRLYVANKDRIPYAYRKYFVKAAHDWYIENYVELNEYYRILIGEPPMSHTEDDFIMLTDEEYERYNIEEKVPLHKIEQSVLNRMEAHGVLDKYASMHPDWQYIKHVGTRRVSAITARNADNFDILHMPKRVENWAYHREFIRTYESSKEYILSVVYNNYYSSKYKYYDNYLAFLVLMLAVQRLCTEVLKIVVNRDFYDTNTMRLFMTAYGLPFSTAFSINQNRLLVKNLNILLAKKSSSRVLLDIMDLLGFNDFTLVKYYIMKHHKLDNNGDPIFKYLTDEDGNYLYDEDGNKILDAESVYDFYFSGIPIDSTDVQTDIHSNEATVLDYEEMVSGDDLWIEDDTLKKRLMETDFNYMETKYIDVNAIFRLQKIVFETVYTTRIVLDKKENITKNIMVHMNRLNSDQDISLFNVFIFLICLMCKRCSIEPTLLKNPSQILYILGFNFEADFNLIRENIKNNRLPKRTDDDSEYVVIPGLYKSALATYIINTPLDTVQEVNDMYQIVKNLEDLLVDEMREAQSLEVYEAYKTLYQTLMYTRLNNDIYKLKDGTIPETFDEYLEEADYTLYQLYKDADKDAAIEMIEYTTERLSGLLKDSKYLTNIMLMTSEDIDALIRLLRFFQSYTVDVRDSKLVLLLDSKYDNMIKFITYLYQMLVREKIIEHNQWYEYVNAITGHIKLYGKARLETALRRIINVNFMMDNRDVFDEKVLETKFIPTDQDYFASKAVFDIVLMLKVQGMKFNDEIAWTFYGPTNMREEFFTEDELRKMQYLFNHIYEYHFKDREFIATLLKAADEQMFLMKVRKTLLSIYVEDKDIRAFRDRMDIQYNGDWTPHFLDVTKVFDQGITSSQYIEKLDKELARIGLFINQTLSELRILDPDHRSFSDEFWTEKVRDGGADYIDSMNIDLTGNITTNMNLTPENTEYKESLKDIFNIVYTTLTGNFDEKLHVELPLIELPEPHRMKMRDFIEGTTSNANYADSTNSKEDILFLWSK